MFIYIAVLEFICSQSPHSMKGLLIGLFFAINGLYRLLATLIAILLAILLFVLPESVFISCGLYYYLVNIVLLCWCTCGLLRDTVTERETSPPISTCMLKSTIPSRNQTMTIAVMNLTSKAIL